MQSLLVKDIKEDLAISVLDRVFAGANRMRVVIAPHPISAVPSSSVPYLDLADALTCPQTTIYNIIKRSKRVKRYASILILRTEAGLRPTLCIFEEAILHIIMKLQP